MTGVDRMRTDGARRVAPGSAHARARTLPRVGCRTARAMALAVAVFAMGTAARGDGTYERTPAPEGVELYFISPADGATVKSPITVRFGLRGMGVAPAGVAKPHTGHHHLLIDTEVPSYDEPLPSIPGKILHFGGGQTETTIELPPGRHTLQLVLGDHNHVPHEPPVVSKRISITVAE